MFGVRGLPRRAVRGARMPGAARRPLWGAVYRARVAISQPLGAFLAPSLAGLASAVLIYDYNPTLRMAPLAAA